MTAPRRPVHMNGRRPAEYSARRVPVAAVLHFMHAPPVWVFVSGSPSFRRRADGRATENLAETMGSGLADC